MTRINRYTLSALALPQLRFNGTTIRYRLKRFFAFISILVAAGLLTSLLGCTKKTPAPDPATPSNTSYDATVSSDSAAPASQISCTPMANNTAAGQRKLALVIGVGDYANERIPDLDGPANDARSIAQLLTDTNSFAFPKENVCVLLDQHATYAAVVKGLKQFLIDQARPDDIVVFYFAGHGSQIKDNNFDESDGLDETFVLHDSRTQADGRDIHDLTDDSFNDLLAQLHQKTRNVTVILDSCNSGSATRANTALRSRFFEPEDFAPQASKDDSGDGGGWTPEDLPGVVTLTAAVDGTPALEKDGKGLFTDAIIQVLSHWNGAPPTYRQLVYNITPVVKAQSYQVLQFHGDLDRTLFGATQPLTPDFWTVKALGETIDIGGPPLPGMGLGAELRIFAGGLDAQQKLTPQTSKALVKVTQTDGLGATVTVLGQPHNGAAIQLGDKVFLVRPAVPPLSVGLRPSHLSGGVPKNLAQQLQALLSKDPLLQNSVEFTASGLFEVSYTAEKLLQLKGPENRVRSRYQSPEQMLENIALHAKQRAILNLRGESGRNLVENQSLQVSLVPAAKQDSCSKQSVWQQAKPNATQILPLCYRWNIRVTLAAEAPSALNIGGVILSTDGSILGFPADGRTELLRPGDTLTFAGRNETFKATPPLSVEDQIVVFGTHPENPVAWHQLTSAARGAGNNSLQNTLNAYVNQPTRGVGVARDTEDNTQAWTRSIVTAKVEANTRFGNLISNNKAASFREYTIPNFDIRPYLPDDHQSVLYRVLQQADGLAKAAQKDGIGYKQHAWSQGSDAANLALGIDCSRAIWFAFTRAGLTYNNRDNAYLATADMVTSKTAMADQFNQCPANEPYQLGDVLVYRDDNKGDGHVVMVIDTEKRIAWGSHGWDGNSKILPVEPDTGVEYQVIKIKKDWQKWDRSTMTLRKCWRHKSFSELPTLGHDALTNSCDASQCKL